MRPARFGAALVLLAFWGWPATAQQPRNSETIEMGLSTDHVTITAGFSGTDLTIFGAIDNVDPLVARQGRYDVIVVLEGPPEPVVVRKKDRLLGIWLNVDSFTFVNVPTSYSIATTRAFQDIAPQATYKQLSLGPSNYLEPELPDMNPKEIKEYGDALRDLKRKKGLYVATVGGVQFLSQNLFRATLRLAPDVPVGTHLARAFLFKSGAFVRETSAQLSIAKSGVEQRIYDTAHDYSFYYGILSVGIAILTGWLGRVVFRKD